MISICVTTAGMFNMFFFKWYAKLFLGDIKSFFPQPCHVFWSSDPTAPTTFSLYLICKYKSLLCPLINSISLPPSSPRVFHFQSPVSPAACPVVFFLPLSLVGHHFSRTLSPPQQLNAVPPCSKTPMCLHASFPFSLLAQMDGQRKQPMNQSEGCGKAGGRDISSMPVAGAQAA